MPVGLHDGLGTLGGSSACLHGDGRAREHVSRSQRVFARRANTQKAVSTGVPRVPFVKEESLGARFLLLDLIRLFGLRCHFRLSRHANRRAFFW